MSSDLASSGWADLCRDLMTAAHSARNSIIWKGSSTVMNKVFMCGTFYQKTRTSAMNVTDNKPYREILLCNDQMNNQQGSLSYAKRIKTLECRGCTCKFRFIVKWDMLLGFYVELQHKTGHAIHSSHPKLLDVTYLPVSTRLLKPHQIEDALHVVNSTSNNEATRNYLHGRFGKFVNLNKVAYLVRKANGKLDSTNDEIAIIMGDFVNSDEISFVSLLDVSATDSFDTDAQVYSHTSPDDTVTISTFKLSPKDVCYTKKKNNTNLEGLSKQISEE
jgi:hypothetical protein